MFNRVEHRVHEYRFKNKSDLLLIGVLICTYLSIITWSWRKWPDVLIDFGREVYIPWRICNGEVLYRDINHIFGPASHYFNASIFAVFGASCTTIFMTNIVLLSLFIWVVYKLIKKITNSLTSFLCCFTVITTFSFSQYTLFGGCNFVGPYSHEATHGMILSMIILFHFTFYLYDLNKRRIIICGLLTGLILLMKTEISVSIITTTILFLVIKSSVSIKGSIVARKKERFCDACVLIIAALILPACFFTYFLFQMSIQDAFNYLLWPFKVLLNRDIVGSFFYRHYMGLNDLYGNITKIIIGTLLSLITLVACLINYPRSQNLKNYVRYASSFVLSYYILFIDRAYFSYATPVLITIIFCWTLKEYLHSSHETQRKNLLPYLLISCFSMMLMGKMILRFSFYDTGFYLAIPSALVLITFSTFYIPQWLDQRARNGASFRNAAVIVVLVCAIHSLCECNKFYKLKTYSIGSLGNRIVSYETDFDTAAIPLTQTLEWLTNNLQQGDSLAVLPEGVIFNFLTKHLNPTHNINFMPPELSAFGEDNILQSFVNNPPDYILIVHKDTSNYGIQLFGTDPRYGFKIMRWVNSNYIPVQLFGNEPLVDDKFGIKVLKKTTL